MSSVKTFETVYSTTKGIAGYKLDDTFHRVFTYDGDSIGKRNHIVMYRPGKGRCTIVKRHEKTLVAIYDAKSGGIGGFDLSFWKDRAFAYDYNRSGNMDHIVLYRPAGRGCFILKHDGKAQFTPVYAMPAADKPSATAGAGIGGWDLTLPWDRLFAFDYDHSHRNDYIVCYRRAQKTFWILQNEHGKFSPVYKSTNGIGGYEMGAEEDYAFPFDWDHSGCEDHILFVRFHAVHPIAKKPKSQAAVVKHQGDKFVLLWHTYADIGGFTVTEENTRAFVMDFDGQGMNHIGIWTLGQGILWIHKGGDTKFPVRYHQGSPMDTKKKTHTKKGNGLATCKLNSANDRCIAFDWDNTGHNDHILVYRLGTGDVWIMNRTGHHSAEAHHAAAYEEPQPEPPVREPPVPSTPAPWTTVQTAAPPMFNWQPNMWSLPADQWPTGVPWFGQNPEEFQPRSNEPPPGIF